MLVWSHDLSKRTIVRALQRRISIDFSFPVNTLQKRNQRVERLVHLDGGEQTNLLCSSFLKSTLTARPNVVYNAVEQGGFG